LNARTERVKARNQIAADALVPQNVPIDDLFSLVADHPEYWNKDGVHFTAEGSAAQAGQVAQKIMAALK
jgi:lysophospholipase L1-like esterase